ncbi:sugar transporter ERD6-like 5 isoform X2 [Coffea eugenioides]|uniref:sugar transporter ERD6-like 5 isoform X2 n=1 Tax=Coffea eugenioides TaxID=49369 RepID=UPI000F605744|nr:sugar transporter ERD6-like 5 isoform X2 [Coffea eugenioides]
MDAERLLPDCSSQNGVNAEKGSSPKVTFAVVCSSFIVLCCFFTYGCACGYSSPAESGIIHDLGLSTAEYSTFGSLLLFGSMLGAIISGKVADIIGRRGALWFAELLLIIGWLAIAFAKGVWWLIVGRLLLGFSTGVQTYVSIVYLAETIPPNNRGGFTMFMACAGIAVMFSFGNIIPWRFLALIGTIPCIIQLIGLFFVPESPRWLANVGRQKELEASLQWLRGKETDISQEAAEIQDCNQSLYKQPISRFQELLETRYARPVSIGVGLSFLLPWGGSNGVLLYASSIFDTAGCNVGIATTTMSFIQIPFSVLGVLLMDKFGRRPLLMVDLAGACLGGLLIGVGFLLQDLKLPVDLSATTVFVGMQMFFAFYAFGAGLPFVIIAEVFPMNIKGTAGSLAAFINYLNSWIVAYVFNFLFKWSSAGAFFIFSIIYALLILFVLKMLPETKKKSLEEIQALWTQEVH